jgi:hypothetical protein
VPVAKVLLEGGADIRKINAKSVADAVKYITRFDGPNIVELLKLLFEAGYPFNKMDENGETIFHYFVRGYESKEYTSEFSDVMDYFMEKGDVFLENRFGQSAFQIIDMNKSHIVTHILQWQLERYSRLREIVRR